MQPYLNVKRTLSILCLMTMPTLAGCNTTAGFGRDVQQVGSWIEGGATETGSWIYGSDAQASATQTQPSSGQVAAATDEAGMSPEQSMVPAAGNNVVYFRTGSTDIPPDAMEMIRSIAEQAQLGQPEQQGQQEMQGQQDMQTAQTEQGQQEMQTAQTQQPQQGQQGEQGMQQVQVVGYTDSAGPAEFNEQLSQRRAEAVAEALAAEGLPRESIAVQWHGEEQLPVETGDDVHEPDNRRVSISMIGT